MPRCARLDIPGYPRHICIRAVDGLPCLTTEVERFVFLKFLCEAMEGMDFHLHAFVVMSNHVHILATANSKGVVSKVMHSVCLRYAGYFNHRHDRRGPLFQGRYWASIVESQGYFFVVMRYIELNPVRAGMVELPEQFSWSSYAHNTGKKEWRVEITPHEEFLQLGATPEARHRAWAEFVKQGMQADELERIRRRFARNRPYGSMTFEKRFETIGDGSQEPSPILQAT